MYLCDIVPYNMTHVKDVSFMKNNEKVKRLRKHLHLSQADFAEKINVTRETISRIENEKCPLTNAIATTIEETFHLENGYFSTDNMIRIKDAYILNLADNIMYHEICDSIDNILDTSEFINEEQRNAYESFLHRTLLQYAKICEDKRKHIMQVEDVEQLLLSDLKSLNYLIRGK